MTIIIDVLIFQPIGTKVSYKCIEKQKYTPLALSCALPNEMWALLRE